MPGTYRFTKEVPESGAGGLDLVLAPNRTRIDQVSWSIHEKGLDPVTSFEGEAGGVRTGGPYRGVVSVRSSEDDLPPRWWLTIDLSYFGEEPQALDHHWRRAGELGLQDADSELDLYVPLYAELQELVQPPDKGKSQLHLERAFLLHLDEQTLPDLMPLAGVDEQERKKREKAFKCVVAHLNHRMKVLLKPATAPTQVAVKKEDVAVFSGIFLEAVEKRFEGEASQWPIEQQAPVLGQTLQRFASGLLRAPITVNKPDKKLYHFEADSYFVFMFAEFAFLAIDKGPEAHKKSFEALLPHLVRMQRYFVERFHDAADPDHEACKGGKGQLTSYASQPKLQLEHAVVQALDTHAYAQGADLRVEMKCNLQRLAKVFGSFDQPDEVCETPP